MKKIRVINVIIIIFFLLTSNSFSKINNSVIISVGNLPITYLDLVKEMRLIALMSNNKIDDSNKEQFKNIAVQALIKRKIKEIEIKKFKVENHSTKDLDNLILKTSNYMRRVFQTNQVKRSFILVVMVQILRFLITVMKTM